MNYVGRKDDGKYIAPTKTLGLTHLTAEQAKLLAPIAYNKEIAEFAAKERIKYRDAFLIATTEGLTEEEKTDWVLSAKKRL